MATHLHPSNSNRKRFSREGFSPIPGTEQQSTSYHNTNMAYNNGDATIDIPLQQVKTNASSGGGLRDPSVNAQHVSPDNQLHEHEKQGFFRGRRAKAGGTQKHGTGRVGYDGEEDTLTTMGKIYTKISNFSIITKYFFFVLPLGLVIAVPIIVGAITLNHKTGAPKFGGVPIVWFFTWVEIVWCSLWGAKIVAHFMPFVFQILVGTVSSGVRKYKTVLQKLEIPLSLVGWAVTALATFKPLMTRNSFNAVHDATNGGISSSWVNIVQKLLAAAVVSSLVFLAEKTIIQLISINYHRKQFNSRIVQSKRHVYILGLLYDASRSLFPMYCPEFAEEDYTISDQLQLAALGGKQSHKRSGSATPMRVLHNVGRFGDQVTSAFGNVAKEITGREVFNPNSSHSIVVEALERKRTSEALARRIWMSLVVEGREELAEEDILDVLGLDRKTEAEEAYWALDRDGNGDISLDEMIMTVTEWGRERKAIATSMVDVASAINVLDGLLCTVVLIAVVFIIIAFLNTSFVTTLATAGTALLSLSFVFSVTAQEFLGSCIFLFVKHPFDVGDRVDIASEAMTVEHISLLFTVFRRVQGLKTGQLVQYPNIVLNTLALENVSRSKAMTEQITLDISFDTTFDDIQILRNELQKFVSDKENSRDFQEDVEVEILGTTDMSKMQLKVEIAHKSNWANESLRATRRSKFMCALVSALRAVPIYAPGGGGDAAGSAAKPNYSVAISDSEAKENAQSTAADREKARLIPSKKIQEARDANPWIASANSGGQAGAGLTLHDQRVVNDLTSRDPASDPARDEAWLSGRDDSSTLGERPSIDQQDLNDVRGLLRRESTRGKRKPSSEQSRTLYQHPSNIPTINEPQAPTPGSSTVASPYESRPSLNTQPTQYQTARNVPTVSNLQMSQINRNASNSSNPYRSPPRRNNNDQFGEEDDFGNMRPYSGV
ncbi:calcium channel [Lecanosticta acicola]|uniref:Calcium channel n=1 Tax=Lecanosticta acicola TaxID=111012 RepID=A0AAI9E7N6_9PEZI|nr:calcium channel [Lecanosticta acicola]